MHERQKKSTENIQILCPHPIYVGENRTSKIRVSGLDRADGTKYYLTIKSTDGNVYQKELEDDDSVWIDASLVPEKGKLTAALVARKDDVKIAITAEQLVTDVAETLAPDAGTPPTFEDATTLATRAVNAAKVAEVYSALSEESAQKSKENADLVQTALEEMGDVVRGIERNGVNYNPNENGVVTLPYDSPMYGNCDSAGNITIKLVVSSDTKYRDFSVKGDILGVKFSRQNTAPAFSLNVFGDVKPAKYKGGDIPPKMVGTEQIALFQFDGNYWNLLNPANEEWQALPLSEEATEAGGYPISYMKDSNGFIHLSGMAICSKEETTGSFTIGVLPVGYRPPSAKATIILPASSLQCGSMHVFIFSGNIVVMGTDDSSVNDHVVDLNSISFKID